MTKYSLNILFDDVGLQAVNSTQQKVTLIKSVGGASKTAVAWVTFDAIESNTVTWEEDYYFFATDTVLEAGATIRQASAIKDAITTGNLYHFRPEGFFQATPTPSTKGAFDLLNQYDSNAFSFGLSQSATISGTSRVASPLCAVPVLRNETASFTPIETVTVFMSSYSDNGVVMTDVDSHRPLVVTLTSSSPSATIHFNDVNNAFASGPLPASLARRRGAA